MRQAAGLIESTMPRSSMVMMPSTAASRIARSRCSFSLKAASISLYASSLEGIVAGTAAPMRDHNLRAIVPVRTALLQRKRIHCSTPGAENSPSIAESGPNLQWDDSHGSLSKLSFAESQRVGDDGNGTEAHRSACDDGAEQHAKERIERPRSDGDPEGVVDESEEKVLADISHHRAAQSHRLRYSAQIAFDESDAGAFHRDIGASTHRDADVSSGERGRVVDAVAGHRHDLALLPELLHALVFALRFDVGLHLVKTQFPGDGVRGAFVVAGQHDDCEAELMKLRNGFRRGLFDGVGHGEQA